MREKIHNSYILPDSYIVIFEQSHLLTQREGGMQHASSESEPTEGAHTAEAVGFS